LESKLEILKAELEKELQKEKRKEISEDTIYGLVDEMLRNGLNNEMAKMLIDKIIITEKQSDTYDSMNKSKGSVIINYMYNNICES
ncbi:MAG: hypothetical protein K0R31_1693, partial [Clostridiales bacterium]|nr:hypothetical protein [Clostridiales bacterium]